MNPPAPASGRIPVLLERLETRARRGAGLYPVRTAGDFLALARAHLGLAAGPVTSGDAERIASALALLLDRPAEASLWANRLLLSQPVPALRAVPVHADRHTPDPSALSLELLLRGENTCPPPAVRSAS